MNKRAFKVFAYTLAGVAYFSFTAFAAQQQTKSPAATGTATPAPHDTLQHPSTGQAPMTGAPTGAQTAIPLTDAQVLGVVNAVDEHEIDAATKVMKGKISAEAMGYAKMLKEQHGANKEKTKALSKSLNMKPAPSKVSDDLQAKGKKQVKAMSATDSASFEKAYIDAMVNGHTEVLGLIDTQLIPVAQNQAVKSHLAEFRTHVAAHLEQGKRLQGAAASRTE